MECMTFLIHGFVLAPAANGSRVVCSLTANEGCGESMSICGSNWPLFSSRQAREHVFTFADGARDVNIPEVFRKGDARGD